MMDISKKTLTFAPQTPIIAHERAFVTRRNQIGKMPEWSIGAVSKTVVPLREPRVRIPVFPQKRSCKLTTCGLFFLWKAG